MQLFGKLFAMASALCLSVAASDLRAQSSAQQAPATTAPPAATAKPLRSPDVMYVPTPPEVVDAMLKVGNVRQGDVLYDLGSGDGRIPITAVQKYNVTRATGIEINPDRIEEAQRNLTAAGFIRCC